MAWRTRGPGAVRAGAATACQSQRPRRVVSAESRPPSPCSSPPKGRGAEKRALTPLLSFPRAALTARPRLDQRERNTQCVFPAATQWPRARPAPSPAEGNPGLRCRSERKTPAFFARQTPSSASLRQAHGAGSKGRRGTLCARGNDRGNASLRNGCNDILHFSIRTPTACERESPG